MKFKASAPVMVVGFAVVVAVLSSPTALTFVGIFAGVTAGGYAVKRYTAHRDRRQMEQRSAQRHTIRTAVPTSKPKPKVVPAPKIAGPAEQQRSEPQPKVAPPARVSELVKPAATQRSAESARRPEPIRQPPRVVTLNRDGQGGWKKGDEQCSTHGTGYSPGCLVCRSVTGADRT
jgi:hypothetical protein